MMNKLSKEDYKKILLNTIINSVLITIIIYLVLGPFNNEIVNIMQEIKNNNSVFDAIIIIFPIIIIFYLSMNIAVIVSKKKGVKNEKNI